MCVKYHAFGNNAEDNASMAVEKDGGYPTNIFNGYFSMDVEEPQYLEVSLDALESGFDEELDDPIFIVTHYKEEQTPNEAKLRP